MIPPYEIPRSLAFLFFVFAHVSSARCLILMLMKLYVRYEGGVGSLVFSLEFSRGARMILFTFVNYAVFSLLSPLAVRGLALRWSEFLFSLELGE